MTQVKLDELENAMTIVDEAHGEAKAWVERDTGVIQFRDDEYLDDEAPLPGGGDEDDGADDGRYVPIPGLRTLGLGAALPWRFAEKHMPGDRENVEDLLRETDPEAGFVKLLEARGAADEWKRFHDTETRTALQRWCEDQGLQVAG